MKNSLRPTSGRRSFSRMLLAGIMIATSLGMAHATNYYWDVNGTTAGSGANGSTKTWSSGTNTWNTDPLGGSAGTTPAVPTSSDDAYFAAGSDVTTGLTVNVSGAVSIKGFTFNTNGTATMTLGGSTGNLTIGSDGITVTGGAATGTTDVLNITTGSNATATLTIGAAQTWNIANGVLYLSTSNINYANQLTFGGGTFILGSTGSGEGTYTGTGGVRINGGNVQLGDPPSNPATNPFGSGALELSAGSLAKWGSNTGTVSISNTTTVDGNFTLGVTGTVPMNFTGSVTFSNTPTVTLNNGGGLNFNGVTTLGSNVSFNGTGTTTFTTGIGDGGGNHGVTYGGTGRYNLVTGSTYTGGTTISGGAVVATNTVGSATGTGSLTVSGTGVLVGSGIIGTSGVTSGTAVTIASGGTLDPGGSTGTFTAPATVLTFNLHSGSSMQLNSGANFVFDLGAMNLNDSVTPGTATSDLIRISGGTLNLNSIDLSDFTIKTLAGFNVGDYNLFAADAPGDITGTLGPLLTQAFTFNGSPYSYTLAITNGGQDLTLEVVPEPSTWAMMLGGLGVLIFCVRRRNLSDKSRV